MSLLIRHAIAGALLLTGFLAAATALFRVWRRERSRAGGAPGAAPVDDATSMSGLARRHRTAFALAVLLAVAGAAVAFEGIERRGMTHVEVYVPGIVLPPDISEPPSRLGLADALWWHVHSEPHPPGWYVMMWGWTKVFGTSLIALRTPSVLFGALAILLTFFLAARMYGAAAGVIAAGLLALNGHHVYWMQQARMYELSLLLALASMWFWIDTMQASGVRSRSEGGYVASTVMGVYTQMYFWPLLAAQMMATVLSGSRPGGRLHRVFGLQTLVVILGAPLWAHAVYQARNEPTDATSLSFSQDLLNFGFLFMPDVRSEPMRDVPWTAEAALTMLALVLLAAFAARNRRWSAVESPPGVPAASLLVPAIGVALMIIGWSFEVNRRAIPVALTAAVPLIAVSCLALLGRDASPLQRLRGIGGRDTLWLSPIPAVVIGVVAATFAIGMLQPFLTSRGYLVIVPLLLMVFAAGLAELLARRRLLGATLVAILAIGHVWSIAYYREVPGSNDYRGLAAQLQAELEADDLILVRRRDWVTTPIFYYLPDRHAQLVARDHRSVVEGAAARRVWVLQFSDVAFSPAILEAIDGLEPARRLESFRSRAILYTRKSARDTTRDTTVTEEAAAATQRERMMSPLREANAGMPGSS